MSVIENYTVLDIETTGLSPINDNIIEISGLKVRDNKVVKEFSSLIKSDKPVNGFITNLTGITDSMLSDAPDIKTVLPEFMEFLSDDIILGHNISFDLGFIRTKLRQHFQQDLFNKSMDTRYIAKSKIKLMNYKLVTIAKHFGIDTKNNHRGLKDCYITFEVYNALNEIAKFEKTLLNI